MMRARSSCRLACLGVAALLAGLAGCGGGNEPEPVTPSPAVPLAPPAAGTPEEPPAPAPRPVVREFPVAPVLSQLATAGFTFQGSGIASAYGVASANDGMPRSIELAYQPEGSAGFARSQTIIDASGRRTQTVRFAYRDDGDAQPHFTGFSTAATDPSFEFTVGPSLPPAAVPDTGGWAFTLRGLASSWSYSWSLVRVDDASADLCLTIDNSFNMTFFPSWEDCVRIDGDGTILGVRVLVRDSSRFHGDRTLYE